MGNINEELNKNSDADLKRVFLELVDAYCNPSFGTMPKREFDILLFSKLCDLGVFPSLDIYEIQSLLKVTQAKARNLVYERQLRSMTTKDLDARLKDMLKTPILEVGKGGVKLDVDNPLLMDHLKHKLKELKHFSDGSFSKDIVVIKPAAYVDLYLEYYKDIKIEELTQNLGKMGIKKKFKDVFVDVVKKCVDTKIGEGNSDNVLRLWSEFYRFIRRENVNLEQLKEEL